MAGTMPAPVGCLLIDDLMSGENRLSGLSFSARLRAYPFYRRAGEPLLDSLQALLQRARAACGETSVLARGTGCGAALALAEQLPVARLALIEPAEALEVRLDAAGIRGRGIARSQDRQLRRLNAFARRNLSLCVSDILVVEGERSRGWRLLCEGGASAYARLMRLPIPAETGAELYTICENTLNRAIIDFLQSGECPKHLAENREMCIIYR